MSTPWNKIRNEIKTLSKDGARFALAVSGGVDSMFMLDFFNKLDIEFIVLHFNHKIRTCSDYDQRMVGEVVENLSPHRQLYFGYGQGLSGSTNLECSARIQRWNFLTNMASYRGCTHVVTGHHLNDQVENILIRLMRGDSHNELAMSKLREVDGIFRYKPFLDVSKEIILKQSKSRQLTWREDSTNADTTIDRNWLRHDIIPQLMARRNIMKTIPKGILR